jgi:hypothetical protein
LRNLCERGELEAVGCMAKLLYCWRCKMDIPMLDESEWEYVRPREPADDQEAFRREALSVLRADRFSRNEYRRTFSPPSRIVRPAVPHVRKAAAYASSTLVRGMRE